MSQAPLVNDLDFVLESLEDGCIPVGDQPEVLECLENADARGKELVPVPVVGANVDPCHPNLSPRHVLNQDLQLLSPFLNALDADSRPVGLSFAPS